MELDYLLGLINKYQIIIGFILGWPFARFWEEIRKPQIEMSIGHEALWPSDNSPQTKFLHIKVINKKRKLPTAMFLGHPTANNTRAWISFLDFNTKIELLKINGRWITKKEPVDYAAGKIDLAEALIPPRETIPADEESSLSVALKDVGKSQAFAFNNESYLYQWRKDEFKLEEKRYLVRVKVSAEGKEWIRDFILLNLGTSLKNFKISEIE